MNRIIFLFLLIAAQVRGASIVICEGDSLTFGTGASAGSNYVSQMALFTTYGAYATNIGASGHLIATNISAFDTLRNLTNAGGYGKKTVVFLMMLNDIVVVDDTVANVTTNYNIWADNVKAAFPETKIMVLTQFDADINATELGKVADVNNWLRTNASGRLFQR
jgi:hypothetical protein